LLLALRRLSEAFGGVTKLAALSIAFRTGNPELRSVNAPLKAMGMRLSVQPLEKAAKKSAA